MTTLQLDAQIQRDYATIKDDDSRVRRLAKYLRRLVKEKEDPTLMTKEEFFAKIDKSLRQAEEGKVTRISSKEELHRFLDSL